MEVMWEGEGHDGDREDHLGGQRQKCKRDGASTAQQWQRWLARQDVKAVVCVGAAQRRGMVATDADNTLAEGFSLAGLGQSAEALISTDRVIQFGYCPVYTSPSPRH